LDKVVARYSQPPYNVHHWILWSEPDAVRNPTSLSVQSCVSCGSLSDRGAWGEDVAAYVQTMQAAYAHIHNTDSNAILIMGPMAYDFFYDPTNTSPGFNSGGLFLYSFIDNVLTELAKSNTPAFDAIAINAYIPFGRNWESDAVKKGRTGVDV